MFCVHPKRWPWIFRGRISTQDPVAYGFWHIGYPAEGLQGIPHDILHVAWNSVLFHHPVRGCDKVRTCYLLNVTSGPLSLFSHADGESCRVNRSSGRWGLPSVEDLLLSVCEWGTFRWAPVIERFSWLAWTTNWTWGNYTPSALPHQAASGDDFALPLPPKASSVAESPICRYLSVANISIP
jgi:hypothetical protein